MQRYLLLIIAGLALIVFTGCTDDGQAETSETTVEQPKAAPVRYQSLKAQSFSDYMHVTGTVKARNHIDLTVEEGGTVKEIRIDKGSYAREGDILAVLDNPLLTAGFNQAKAALNQAELEYGSRKVLYDKKAISENEYLGSKYALDAARAAFELAEARIRKLSIVAPMSGLVNDRYYDLGAYASPMTAIYEFIDNSSVRVKAGVAERYMGDVKQGTEVLIHFDAYPELELKSKITYVSRSVDPQNRTFDVEINLQNKNHIFAPEMVADVQILRKTVLNAIVVPIDAMIESESGWHVFLEVKNRAKRKLVKKVAIYQNAVLVTGLAEADHLIISGQHRLHDGDPVQVVE